MHGLMMDMPLLISDLIRRADRHHGDTQIVSKTVEGGVHRYDYRAAHRRARQLAQALLALGVKPGERIASLAWNGYRHFELYYAVSGIGAVMHTINPRLFADQIAYIANDAADTHVFFDLTFLPLIEQLAPRLPAVERFVALTDRAHMPKADIPKLACYEALLEGRDGEFAWPSFDERTASSLCYTSGTTGNPKGVLYHHRSTLLHTYMIALPDSLNISAREVVLPAVPMFHVNAWGTPYACTLAGSKLVLPGPHLDGKSLYELIEAEGVTLSAGVPTVWLGLLEHLDRNKLRISRPLRIVVGGSACPPSMMRRFEDDYGVQLVHAWGMTEMNPVGTIGALKGKHAALDEEARFAVRCKAGRALYGVEMKIVDQEGKELPRDGRAFGDLLVRGPTVLQSYYKGAGGDPLVRDENGAGWFPTGDVVTLDADGYIQITDRSKDVIKSGGEWISSIELENIAIAHPAIAEAAVVGVPHPKWDERPIVVAVARPGAGVTREELLSFFDGKVAKWWLPEDVVFVPELPHTATGKLSKLQLREQLKGYRLPQSRAGGRRGTP